MPPKSTKLFPKRRTAKLKKKSKRKRAVVNNNIMSGKARHHFGSHGYTFED